MPLWYWSGHVFTKWFGLDPSEATQGLQICTTARRFSRRPPEPGGDSRRQEVAPGERGGVKEGARTLSRVGIVSLEEAGTGWILKLASFSLSFHQHLSCCIISHFHVRLALTPPPNRVHIFISIQSCGILLFYQYMTSQERYSRLFFPKSIWCVFRLFL